MANENEIPLVFKAETKEAESSISNFQKGVENSVGKVQASFLKIATAIASVATVATVLKKSFAEAIEAEDGFAKLNFALATTGEFSREASASMAAFATEIQKTTTFSDEAATQALTLAKNFGLTNEKAKDLVKVATDLAAQTGDSLPAATERLLASLNGQSKALKDLGPAYKRLTEEQSLAGEGVRLVKEQLSGAAVLLSGKFSGALDQAKNNFSDIFEEIGKAIIQNPKLVASINLLSGVFASLAEKIGDNKDVISNFVTDAIVTMAKGLISAIEALSNLNSALGKIKLKEFTIALTAATVASAAFFLVFKTGETIDVLLKTGSAIEAITVGIKGLTIASSGGGIAAIAANFRNIAAALSLVAGAAIAATASLGALFIAALPFLAVAAAVAAVAIGIDALQASIRGVPSGFDRATGRIKATNEETEKFSAFLEGVPVASKNFSDATDDVEMSLRGELKALIQTSAAADKNEEALIRLSKAAKKAGPEFGKLAEEAKKFSDELLKEAANPYEKASLARAKELEDIQKFRNAFADKQKEADQLEIVSREKFESTVSELQSKYDAEELDRVTKQAEKKRKIISEAFANPVKGIVDAFSGVNFNFSNIIESLRAEFSKPITDILRDLSDALQSPKLAAIGLGITSAMLEGAKGAQKFLAASVGAIVGKAAGDAFGPIAGQIADQLITLGPDGAKAMVREFVDALPDLITKLADAIPAVVEALVDSLITKGGIVKIAVALLRAMAGESLVKAIGKQIGVSFTEVANDELIKTARNMAIILSVPFFGAIYVFRNEIKQAFVDAANQIGPVFAVAGGQLAMGFKDGISDIFSVFSSLIASTAAVGPLLSNPLSGALDRIPNLGDGISNKIKDAANFFKERVDLPFDSIKDFLSNFKIDLPNIGGSDDGFLGTGLATGGLVPPGYNNDTFPARLTSGELVIPKDLVGSLSDFLDVGLSPKKDNGDLNTAILGKIAALLGQPMNVESSINISGQVFADIMLKLSRNNARITA